MKWYEWWVLGWIEVVEGITHILTLGLYQRDWCYLYVMWVTERKIERKTK